MGFCEASATNKMQNDMINIFTQSRPIGVLLAKHYNFLSFWLYSIDKMNCNIFSESVQFQLQVCSSLVIKNYLRCPGRILCTMHYAQSKVKDSIPFYE
jgi:hypothetical protein